MRTGIIINYKGFKCEIIKGAYRNGRTALTLEDVQDGSPVASCTVNVESRHVKGNEVIIKSYHENEGMLECLIAHKVVTPLNRQVTVGFAKADIVLYNG